MAARATEEQKAALLAAYDCFVFDLDGTLWKGDVVIDGALDVVKHLQALGKDVIYVTNNSTKSRAACAKKLRALGFPVQPQHAEVYCSAYAAAAYLKSINFDRKAYVVGEVGLIEELAAVGITAVGGPADKGKTVDWAQPSAVKHDTEIGAVVVGVDPHISYYKLCYASLCLLQNPGCLFVASNTDSRGHFMPHQEWPGAGSAVGAIKGSTEMEPIVVGKPARFMLEEISRTHGVALERMCVVGDRLDTDIQWGHSYGLGTLLLMSGVTNEAMLAAALEANAKNGTVKPDYIMESIADMRSATEAAVAALQR